MLFTPILLLYWDWVLYVWAYQAEFAKALTQMTQSFLPDRPLQIAEVATDITLNSPTSQKEPLKYLLIGSPQVVRRAIHALHVLGYAEVGAWSPCLPTANPGEVMSILIRHSIALESH